MLKRILTIETLFLYVYDVVVSSELRGVACNETSRQRMCNEKKEKKKQKKKKETQTISNIVVAVSSRLRVERSTRKGDFGEQVSAPAKHSVTRIKPESKVHTVNMFFSNIL